MVQRKLLLRQIQDHSGHQPHQQLLCHGRTILHDPKGIPNRPWGSVAGESHGEPPCFGGRPREYLHNQSGQLALSYALGRVCGHQKHPLHRQFLWDCANRDWLAAWSASWLWGTIQGCNELLCHLSLQRTVSSPQPQDMQPLQDQLRFHTSHSAGQITRKDWYLLKQGKPKGRFESLGSVYGWSCCHQLHRKTTSLPLLASDDHGRGVSGQPDRRLTHVNCCLFSELVQKGVLEYLYEGLIGVLDRSS